MEHIDHPHPLESAGRALDVFGKDFGKGRSDLKQTTLQFWQASCADPAGRHVSLSCESVV